MIGGILPVFLYITAIWCTWCIEPSERPTPHMGVAVAIRVVGINTTQGVNGNLREV